MPALRNARHGAIGAEARGKPRHYKRKAAARLPQSKKKKKPPRLNTESTETSAQRSRRKLKCRQDAGATKCTTRRDRSRSAWQAPPLQNKSGSKAAAVQKRKSPDRHRGALFYISKFTRPVIALSSKKYIICKPLKGRTLACDERRRCGRGRDKTWDSALTSNGRNGPEGIGDRLPARVPKENLTLSTMTALGTRICPRIEEFFCHRNMCLFVLHFGARKA
jgi:hypothetical protein